MPSFNIMHYMLAGAIIFLLLSLGYSKYLSMQLEALQGRYNGFVAQTDSVAQKQIADNWRISANRDEITRNLER